MDVVIAGDVHGDLERLFQALKPYPPAEHRTMFLGDLVDGGAFGVGALRYARDRPNTDVILGNHEVSMLWALHDRTHMPFWMGIGGQPHDLAELRKDEELQRWLEARPLLLQLADGTLCQHTDTDVYSRLCERDEEPVIDAINDQAAMLIHNRDFAPLWDILSAGKVFRASEPRLDAWLRETGSTRVVHGHVPHNRARPDVYAGGRAINYDGSLSRFYGSRYLRKGPAAATVGPLPPLVHSVSTT